MATPTPRLEPVPIVLIGITRATALEVSSGLASLPSGGNDSSTIDARPAYTIAAALDLTESPKAYQFSPQNLGVLLHALHPRPRALITGTALTTDKVKQIAEVWGEYVQGAFENEVGGSRCWVALSRTHGQPGPPPPGVFEEMVRQLDDAFAVFDG